MKKIFILICAVFLFSNSFSQAKRYMRKANRIIEKSDFNKAKDYYLKAYNLDKNKYEPNEGLGLIYAELMGNYQEAIPYLETALKVSPKDTSIDVIYALGKSYHHIGEYQKALDMYQRLQGSVALEDDDKQYQLDVTKRKEDCNYALKNNTNKQGKFYIINAGKNINTSAPEYVPVVNNNQELIFTSKRKDQEQEKLNLEDGKYFESMYISKVVNGKPQGARRYTVPDLLLKSNFKKRHESVISMSPDGKILFVYRDSKIYEIPVDSISKAEPTKLSKTINFDYYQSHAYLSKDGKTILFTSEDEGGMGGLDIYKSTKNSTGQWEKPENLGGIINTIYDEDSPYLTDDGKTLYFSSKGHPGYGSYDVYKSTLQENGEWSVPENLGLPINSPAHDIFYTLESPKQNAYFSSSRIGGFGDMDIYKLVDLTNLDQLNPTENNNLLAIKSEIKDAQNGVITGTMIPSENLKVLSYNWLIDDKAVNDNGANITTTVSTSQSKHTLLGKIIAYCDTCFEPIALLCKSTIVFEEKTPVTEPASDIVKNQYDPDLQYNYLNTTQVNSLGISLAPIYFNLNKSELRNDATEILNTNINVLKEHKEISVLIYGFADARGSESYNQALSNNRAQIVKQYLIKHGISSKQIKFAKGKGEQFLVNNCTEDSSCSDAEHEKNRRVELMLFYNSK